jgi:hypothetical protein
MILISHRGNIIGPNKSKENSLDYIQDAINLGLDVEVDLWVTGNDLFLGHDYPQYKVSFEWLRKRYHCLWIHCKNIESISYLKSNIVQLNYFWHENDTLTLTSEGYIWSYPGKQPIKNSIAVLPELNNDDVSLCSGICSDFILNYK